MKVGLLGTGFAMCAYTRSPLGGRGSFARVIADLGVTASDRSRRGKVAWRSITLRADRRAENYVEDLNASG